MVTTGGNLSEERFPPDLFLKTSASFLAGTNNFIKKAQYDTYCAFLV
jgi:hypothetical protein